VGNFDARLFGLGMLAGLAQAIGPVAAAGEPMGLWYDHTGRGAIEIAACGSGLCGKLVWLKDAGHKDVCGTQIIGDAKPVATGKWDGGWIYDPERAARYSVEITQLAADRLQIVGYLGTKWLSETHIWTRAPAGLKRCGAS
jgi:uncharacterized protein (DUF2147 family)